MEKLVYCHHCKEKHIASETMDTNGKVVGVFCNRMQAIIVSNTTYWNDEDVYPTLERFAESTVDKIALSRIKPDKINGLSRKISYLFVQTEYAKTRSINYFFAQYHIKTIITRMRSKVRSSLDRGV